MSFVNVRRNMALALAALALAWNGYVFTRLPMDGEVLSALDGSAPASRPAERPVSDPPSSLEQFVSRPLFSRERRPQAPAPVAAPTTNVAAPAVALIEPPKLSAKLIGVVLSPQSNAAILQLEDGRTATASVGTRVESWTVSKIAEDGVTLAVGSETRELRFAPHAAGTSIAMSPEPIRPLTRRRP